MARQRLPRITREYSSLLHHDCVLSDRVLGGRSVLFTARLRVCRSDCTERAGSVVRFAGVPSIPRGQISSGIRRLATREVLSGTRPATLGNDVVDLCAGGVCRANWTDYLAPVHSRPRSGARELELELLTTNQHKCTRINTMKMTKSEIRMSNQCRSPKPPRIPTHRVRHLVILSSFVIPASSFVNPGHQ